MSDPARRVAENLARVREQMAAAAARSGRTAGAVRLVGVTKGVPLEIMRHLIAAGCRDLGESRPQELWSKAEALGSAGPGDCPDFSRPAGDCPNFSRGQAGDCPNFSLYPEKNGTVPLSSPTQNTETVPLPSQDAPAAQSNPIRWHAIGHLQRNKLRRTLPLVSLVHSVDSLRLLTAIDQEAAALGHLVPVLIEVNVSSDAAKTGLSAEELPSLLAAAEPMAHVQIRGLMGMASLEGGNAAARRDFSRLRELAEQHRGNCPANVSLVELSMGMSGDYEIAIEEGATLVRVGSALWDGVLE